MVFLKQKSPTKEQKKKYTRTESEITKKPADDSKYNYAHSDLMEKMIKSCRRQCYDEVNRLEKEKQTNKNFKTILGFKEHDIMNVTEKATLDSLRDTFEGENIQTHY